MPPPELRRVRLQGQQVPLRPDELAEARVRLAVGLKRYFHGKRMEGLLSSRVRLLSIERCSASWHACRQVSED